MSDIHGHAKIDDMRRRLYERGVPAPAREHTTLIDTPEAVPRQWSEPPEPKETPEIAAAPETPAEAGLSGVVAVAASRKTSTSRRKFRRLVLFSGLGFFVSAIVLSSIILLWGNNSISADNIAISLNGPFTIGGGETLTIQVGITNANAVAISAATLIIEYPQGTQAADGSGSTLFIERQSLDDIGPGETINVPIKAIVFGEENTEQEISASVEYRVVGSNATFFKEAEVLRYKISSAPVVLQVRANQRVSSGQETDIAVTVRSNSQSPISDILVVAEYPNAFDFSSSDPAPVRGQNTWLIESLEPNEEFVITTRGIVVGQETDELAVQFAVGVPREGDVTTLASIFNTAATEFIIEQPFIDIALELDSADSDSVVVEPGQAVSGRLVITNTLDDVVYDTRVELTLAGNALSNPAVSQTDGFYDSNTNQITWDPASHERLVEMQPGESVSLSFSLVPNEEITRTPAITLSADVESRRVRENRVPEVLTGSVEGLIQVATLPSLISEARRTAGPVPPRAESVTEYTISILAESQNNSLNDVVVTAILPPSVTFGADTSDTGSVAYNPTSRTMTWSVGSITAGAPAVGSYTVSLRPSVTQIGNVVILTGDQRLRATDAFTGTVVRTEQEAVTTELSTELGFEPGNGRVVE